jgi:hypothetical protein
VLLLQIGRVYLETQLGWFRNTIDELKQMIGDDATRALLARSLFTLSAGSNDYLNNYLLELSPTASRYTAPKFQALLLDHMSSYLDVRGNAEALVSVSVSVVFLFSQFRWGSQPLKYILLLLLLLTATGDQSHTAKLISPWG